MASASCELAVRSIAVGSHAGGNPGRHPGAGAGDRRITCGDRGVADTQVSHEGASVNRSRVNELHYLTPIANIPSITERGILSHSLARRYEHISVANQSVQAQRSRVRLPNNRHLHSYVNLYFDARNPMMYTMKQRHESLAVLRVDPRVLELPGVMISDGNAAAGLTRFSPPNDEGFAVIDEDSVFAIYWNHADPQVKEEQKRKRCAEVLVPDRIPPEFITGAYVSCQSAKDVIIAANCGILPRILERLFFRGA
ncbi:hypothetical protein BH23CHL5_BH23CHL5_21850 [soil metagenome]